MKYITLTLIIGLLILSCTKIEKENTTLIGITEQIQEGTKVYLVDQNFYEEGGLLDSVLVKNNKFEFTFNSKEPRMFLIKLESSGITKTLILKSGVSKIKLKDNFEKIEYISNQEETLDLIEYRKNRMENEILSFIKNNPSKFLSTLLLWNERNNLSEPELVKLYKIVPEKWKKTIYGRDIEYVLNSNFKPEINSKFPNFSLKNENENIISLSKVNSKIIFIDFTASWCSPCMAQIPFQKKLYEKYKSKGLEIIHIYLENKEKMLKVRNDKKIPWITLYDKKAFRSELAKKFKINSIPRLFLINSNKEIIGNEESDFIKYEGMNSFEKKYALMEKELDSLLK